MEARDLSVLPADLERLRMGARSALGESPALQAYLAARYVALSVDAGATSDARLTTRAYEIQQLMTDLFIRPSASTQREVRL